MSTSSPPSASKVPAANLPNITVLRQELDYGNAQLARCSAFYDDVRAFRKKFQTSGGIPGPDLHDWKSRDHQAGLTDMTMAYLETHGNGALFWPDDSSAANYNKWQYSRDHYRIKKLVKQLFFRLNQQQYRNAKYKSKGKLDPSSTGRTTELDPASPGRTTENPIDLSKESSPEHQLHPTPSKRPPPTAVTSDADGGIAPPRIVKRERDTFDDYAVPSSPEPAVETNASKSPTKRPARPRSSAAGGIWPGRAKRQRPKPSALDDDDFPSARRKPSSEAVDAAAKRTSPRNRPVLESMDDAIEAEGVSVNISPTGRPTGGEDNPENRPPIFPDKSSTSVIGGPERPPSSSHSPPPPKRRAPNPAAASPSPMPARPDEPIRSTVDEPYARFQPLPTPSTVRQASEQSELPKSEPRIHGKPSIDFVYRLVLSRDPVYSYRKWEPSRKLEELSFREFMGELSLDETVQGLVFTVEGPGLKAVEAIRRGDETGFDFLRRQIKKVIRGQLARRGLDARLVFEMEVEPMLGDNAGKDEDIDDEDFVI